MFRDLFTAAFKLTDDQRRKTVRAVAVLAGLILICCLLLASHTATSEPGADHPIWEVAILFRLALARLILAIALIPASAFIGVALYQVLENTQLGKRLLVWSDSDTGEVMARKVANAGLLASVCLATCIVGLLLGVLR